MVLLALLVNFPAAADVVRLKCRIRGPGAVTYGRLSVMVDLDARWVEVEAEKAPGLRWGYHDGTVGPILTGGPDWVLKQFLPGRVPVAQFVNVTPQSIVVGARDLDGHLVKIATLDRSALRNHSAACWWRSSEEFGVG